jgi:hypothetical protein
VGFGYWPQPPIPNPQSPIPNPHKLYLFLNNLISKVIIKLIKIKNNKLKNIIK